MKKIDPLNQVAAFHRTFKHPVEPQPIIPAQDRCRLRVALLEEELKELKKAIDDEDLVEIADALCDLQYVLSGAVLEFGLGEIFPDLFDEVQRSNMSKTCKDREEALATQKYYREERGFESTIEESEGQYLVYRIPDRKTLKSIAYSPADLASILNGDEG
jgi:predicted HAD superfamily Cof-like phosphohydrolase